MSAFLLAGQVADPPAWVVYTSLAAAIASAVVALTVGVTNRRIAKRALELSERQEARRERRVDLDLVSATSWRSAGERVLGVHLLISNPTEAATSIVGSQLHLTYSVGGVLTTVKVPTGDPPEAFQLPKALVAATLPIRLEPNSAVSSFFVFRIKDELTAGRVLERYDMNLRDVHGVEESLQISIFHEVGDERTT